MSNYIRSVLLALAPLGLAACGLGASDFQAYQGAARLGHEIAIIDNLSGCPYCVAAVIADDQRLFYAPRDGKSKTIMLRPGTYKVIYGEHGYLAHRSQLPLRTDEIVMSAGSRYRVVRCLFCLRPPRYWIEDEATGRVVGGGK